MLSSLHRPASSLRLRAGRSAPRARRLLVRALLPPNLFARLVVPSPDANSVAYAGLDGLCKSHPKWALKSPEKELHGLHAAVASRRLRRVFPLPGDAPHLLDTLQSALCAYVCFALFLVSRPADAPLTDEAGEKGCRVWRETAGKSSLVCEGVEMLHNTSHKTLQARGGEGT